MNPKNLGTELAKLVAVVAVAAVVGLGVGLGISEVEGDEAASLALPPAAPSTVPTVPDGGLGQTIPDIPKIPDGSETP